MSRPADAGTRRVATDITIQILARVVNLILGIFVTLILVRGLGSASFGAWSAIFAVTQIVAGIGELGLGEIVVNRASADPEGERDWLGALLSLRLLLALPMMIASVVVVLLILPAGQERTAGVIISCGVLIGVPTALNIVFQLRVRNDISMAIVTFNSVIWGVGVVAVALLSGGIIAFAAVFVGASAMTAALTAVLALRITPVRLHGVRRLWRPILRIGVLAGIGGMLITLYVKVDQILVLNIAGSRQAGLYGAAYRLLEQIQFIPAAVMTTLFPLIARAYARRSDRTQTILQAAGEYLAMASLPVLAFTIVAAQPIMTLLFGDEFAEAAAALPILAGAFVSISFGYLVGNMVVVLELQRRFAFFAAIALVLNVALNLAFIPTYGFVAAAWITVLTEFTVMSLSMRMVLRAIAMTPRFGRLLRTVLAATIMGLATWLAHLAGMPLSALAVVAAATYLPLLLALRVVTVAELRGLLVREPAALVD